MDIFATLAKAHLLRFYTRFLASGVEGVDALKSPWPLGLLYAFPPLPLFPRVIRKALAKRMEILLLAPH